MGVDERDLCWKFFLETNNDETRFSQTELQGYLAHKKNAPHLGLPLCTSLKLVCEARNLLPEQSYLKPAMSSAGEKYGAPRCSLSPSLSLVPSLSLSLSLSRSRSLSLSLSLSFSLKRQRTTSQSLSHSLCLSLARCFSLCLSLSLHLSPALALFLPQKAAHHIDAGVGDSRHLLRQKGVQLLLPGSGLGFQH